MAQIAHDHDQLQSKQAGHNFSLDLSMLTPSDADSESDSDSDSEDVDIFELRRRMWKDQLLLAKLEQAAARSKQLQCTNKCRCSIVRQPQPSRKTELSGEDGVLHYMLKVMRDCDARGFVYGILPNNGPPITGSSDSLRAWWKDTVAFDRNAPLALLNPEALSPVVEQCLDSYLPKLQDMNDHTIGSILSALIQHCEPPQRTFPLDQGTMPPWWPTGKETWWGLQGQVHAQLGPPPYRKPHDLRKGWKLSLLAAVIKHMSPRFDRIRNLVWQSKRLQHKMSAKDVDTWSRVLNHEEALLEQTKKSLVITPMDKDGDGDSSRGNSGHYADDVMSDTRKRKWVGNENWCEGGLLPGDLCPSLNPLLLRKLEATSNMAAEQRIQCYVNDEGRRGGDNSTNGADYLSDDETNNRRRKLLMSENGKCDWQQGLVSGDLWPTPELDSNSINELLLLYPQQFKECLTADLSCLI